MRLESPGEWPGYFSSLLAYAILVTMSLKTSIPVKLRDADFKELEKLKKQSKVSVPTMVSMAATLFLKRFKNDPEAVWECYTKYRSELNRQQREK